MPDIGLLECAGERCAWIPVPPMAKAVLASLLCAAARVGCAPTFNTSRFADARATHMRAATRSSLHGAMPRPSGKLLRRQPAPDCDIKATDTDERQKLDYERQCYRHAEGIARDRLHSLQDWVKGSLRAIKAQD